MRDRILALTHHASRLTSALIPAGSMANFGYFQRIDVRSLVKDFATNPLVPGSVLGSIAGDPQLRKLHPLEYPALLTLNKQNTLETVSFFQSAGMIKADQAEKILTIDSDYIRAFRELCGKIPEIAEVTGCDK